MIAWLRSLWRKPVPSVPHAVAIRREFESAYATLYGSPESRRIAEDIARANRRLWYVAK